ncbi:hypothetical protein EJ08DRAFT_203695 [Tothia fuscella]|uniref:UBC core domain-containing protein n=1 Tax=Tothia fuscella TaxID=1048955 RepID=A0A9P4NTG7_9PEZI|nr:hypothetical protein EJ08DRAFT_203695 [Tothia fuscella]
MDKAREVIDLTSPPSKKGKVIDLTIEELEDAPNYQYVPANLPPGSIAGFFPPKPSKMESVPKSVNKALPGGFAGYTPDFASTAYHLAPPAWASAPTHHTMKSASKLPMYAPVSNVPKVSYAKLPKYYEKPQHPWSSGAPSVPPGFEVKVQHEVKQPPPQIDPTSQLAVVEEEVEEIDMTIDRNSLQQFGQMILKRTCKDCKRGFLVCEKDVVKLTKRWSSLELQMNSILLCGKCAGSACAGCGFQKESSRWARLARSAKTSQKQAQLPENPIPRYCCDQGRLFIVWALLCAAEHQKACKDRRDSYFSSNVGKGRSSINPTRPSHFRGKANGTGYGDSHGEYGFPASFLDDDFGMPSLAPHFPFKKRHKPTPPAFKNPRNDDDQVLEFQFRHLALLLPDLEKFDDFDQEPANVLLPMLKRSPILDKAAELLRNDSLDDITARQNLYTSVLEFMRRLASHPATSDTVYGDRIIYPTDAGLLAVSFGEKKHDLRGRPKARAERALTLGRVVTMLQVPCRSMLQRSKALEEEFEATEGKTMLAMCRRICELSDFLQANSPLPRGDTQTYSGKGKAPMKQQETMTHWHKEHCVEEVPDDVFMSNFHYVRDAISPSTVVPQKGRMKQLITEIASLQPSLPEGIYVRHAASRLDMMKVIIVGPQKTPYEGGLFEFDLFCPMTYPNEPPRMHFKTTGGGTAHFNPNLYTDGKVCLSLLGTWSGQPWIPKQSTLLQVFVSLQAMVFCDEPWYNEPGREHQPNAGASQSYNMLIQSLTIPHALTSWIKLTDHPIWQPLIDKHFALNGSAIVNTLKVWNSKAASFISSTGVRSDTYAAVQHPYHQPAAQGPASKLPGLINQFEQCLNNSITGKRKQSSEEQGGRISRW